MKTTTKFKKIFIVSLLVFMVGNVCNAQVTTITAKLASPCTLLSVNEETKNTCFTIYPNPNDNGVVNVQLYSSLDQYSRITIYDMIGRLVFQKNNLQNSTSQNLLLRLDDLNAGIYLIEVKTKKGSETKKLIINK